MAKEAEKAQPHKIKWWLIGSIIIGLITIGFLMFYRLGNIMPGITSGEQDFYKLPLGWHGMYHDPIDLPMKLLYSAVFKFATPVGQFLLRVPSAVTGAVTIIAFYVLLQLWFNTRTAVIGTILFATSAWTLHVSRLANFNVEYLAAMTFFLLSTAIVQKKYQSRYVYWLINLSWGLLLYVPGMIFFLIYNVYRQQGEIGFGMSLQKSFWNKLVYVLTALIWLPVLIRYIIRAPKNIYNVLGFPQHFADLGHILKEFAAVFVHIFAHGPLLPSLWLDRLPILDIFGIIATLAGLFFYLTHLKATRTHLIFVSIVIGAALVALGGSVGLSIVMPIIYILIATGVAYLLSQWLSVFPHNPIARSFGYALISLAIAVSVVYNIRAYFIAWPHNQASVSVFDVKDNY